MKGLAITIITLFSFMLFLSSCGDGNPASVAKPSAPTLSSPANAAIEQPTAVTLTWSTVSAASSYHVQVSSSISFSPLVAEDSSLATATKNLTGLLNGTTYYWRVRAKNSGGVSNWTDTWQFTVINATSATPSAPTLSSPANQAVNQPVTATLSWSTVSNATSYHIQVSSSNDFLSRVVDSSLTAATVIVPWLIDNTTYYWRVSAQNASGVSNWSDTWNFTVIYSQTFWEFGRSQGYLGYWAAPDKTSQDTWLYNFLGNLVVIAKIKTVVDTINISINYDTVETYRGVFTLDSSVTPHTMDIHLLTPEYKGQTIQTIYNFLPPSGSFEECYLMANAPDAARPTVMDQTSDNFLDLFYQWTHN
jgi:hypothetical protein